VLCVCKLCLCVNICLVVQLLPCIPRLVSCRGICRRAGQPSARPPCVRFWHSPMFEVSFAFCMSVLPLPSLLGALLIDASFGFRFSQGSPKGRQIRVREALICCCCVEAISRFYLCGAQLRTNWILVQRRVRVLCSEESVRVNFSTTP
jgi:hypothetical protein